jgi:hypothetical protein
MVPAEESTGAPGQALCHRCGAALPAGARYCPACGARSRAVPPAPPPPETNGKAKASLALGIAGFVAFPVVCSVLAIVLGQVAREEMARRPHETGAGLATAGIVLGILGLIVGLIGAFVLTLLYLQSG